MQKLRCALEPVVLALLRISTGVIMATHGWQKLTDIPKFSEIFANMGFPNPDIMVYLAIAGEFFGGLGLIVGFLTPLAALGVASTMAMAVLKVHWNNGLLASNNGFEYPMTLFFVALFFVVRGAGCISLDALIFRKKKEAATTSETPEQIP